MKTKKPVKVKVKKEGYMNPVKLDNAEDGNTKLNDIFKLRSIK